MDYGTLATGGGPEPTPHAGHVGGTGTLSVSDLHGPAGPPDASFELSARTATVQLASGRKVDALSFNDESPGPELRVRQGDLVEVTLANEDIEQGVTIHWHGVDVPNAEDGVAGVTQNAVLPGERYTYRFRADQVGTFWYHSHQVSSSEVRRGLFGAFVIEPRDTPKTGLDWTVVAHTFDGIPTINGADGLERRTVPRAHPCACVSSTPTARSSASRSREPRSESSPSTARTSTSRRRFTTERWSSQREDASTWRSRCR